jgi:pimeloyl-ACP methyl ester carboxylesterase
MLVLALLAILGLSQAAVNPDALRTFAEVCSAHGYGFEAHNVTTEDGYILTLYRIPAKKDQPITPNKPVVFLQHGLIDLADTWIMNEPCPGFLFSDAGYDVWLGNSRGSYHSLGHVKYNYKTDPQYWKFTWQDMADYDIPAVIPFVLQQTGQKKLTYVGHSQGTLQMFAHLSTDPTFINNLSLFIALAPIGTVRHLDITMFKVIKEIPVMAALEDAGIYEFLPNHHDNLLFYEICSHFGTACDDLIGFFADMQVANDNTERFPVILAHEPGGTSTLNMEHWQQMVDYRVYKVQKFNYGKEGNLNHYGLPDPPYYDYTQIPGPIAIFSGNDDRLADPTDVQWLETTIPASSIVYKNELNGFGHLTFMWGNPTVMAYFSQVISLANQYQNTNPSS